MDNPTQEQKMAAMNKAMEAMDPPVPETMVTERFSEVLVAGIWSQVPLIMATMASGQPDVTLGSMFIQPLVPTTPELEARTIAHNKQGIELAEDMLKAMQDTTH